MKIKVFVRLKAGVLDVQGKAIEQGLNGLGFKEVSNVRVGKLIEFEVEGNDFNQAKERVDEMCRSLLANTVIESFQIEQANES